MMREKGGVLGGENLVDREQKDALESPNDVGLFLRQLSDVKLPFENRQVEIHLIRPRLGSEGGPLSRAGKFSF
jgi:hypothetical protein